MTGGGPIKTEAHCPFPVTSFPLLLFSDSNMKFTDAQFRALREKLTPSLAPL